MMKPEQTPPPLAQAAEESGIGQKMRVRRKVRNLSLQEAALRAEISIGFLS